MSELPAGRELDALIAEKVMHWEVREEYVMGWLSHGGGMMKLYHGEGLPHTDGSRWGVDGFRPSTDIKAAWEVVEKLGARFAWELNVSDICVATVLDAEDGYRQVSYGNRKTMPEAICAAALQAVGYASESGAVGETPR